MIGIPHALVINCTNPCQTGDGHVRKQMPMVNSGLVQLGSEFGDTRNVCPVWPYNNATEENVPRSTLRDLTMNLALFTGIAHSAAKQHQYHSVEERSSIVNYLVKYISKCLKGTVSTPNIRSQLEKDKFRVPHHPSQADYDHEPESIPLKPFKGVEELPGFQEKEEIPRLQKQKQITETDLDEIIEFSSGHREVGRAFTACLTTSFRSLCLISYSLG